MRRVEAEHTARLLNAAVWPAGASVRADVCGDGQYVTVRMEVPGMTPVRWKLRRPAGVFTIQELRAECERMLRFGVATPCPDKAVCQDPPWLAETLKRIDRLTKANLVAKGIAIRAARAVEADSLPVPAVTDWKHISVVLTWENLGTQLEVAGDVNGFLSLCLQVPGCPLVITSWPCVNLPRGEPCVAYDQARAVVYDLFGKQTVGMEGMTW